METEITGSDTQAVDGIESNKEDVVKYSSHKLLLDQHKKTKEQLKSFEEKLKNYEAKEQKEKESKLLEDGNLKALIEAKEAKIKELEQMNGDYESKFTDAVKINAFQDAIGGRLREKDYYKFIDTSKIAIDPETGSVDVHSLKSYAKEFVNKHSVLVDFGVGKINQVAPKPNGTDFNIKDLKSKEDYKNALAQVLGKK